MRRVFLLMSVLTFMVGSAFAQSITETVSATYATGDVQTDSDFENLGESSTCPGTLNVMVPQGAVIISVDVEYDMTSALGASMAEQRSQLRCISPGGTDEPEVYSGSGWNEGTYSYNRTGLNIANGVSPFLFGVDFELHAGNTYWNASAGCSADYAKVDINTWTVTVTYMAAGSPNLPTNPSPADMAELIDVESDLTWDFGANTTSYDVYFGEDNPPTTMVVDDLTTAGGSGSYDPGTLSHATTYYWYVVARNTQNEVAGPVWSFITDCEPLTLPYFDNFDTYASETLPDCWLSVNTENNPDCYVRVESNYNAKSAPNLMIWTNWAGADDPNITLVLPKVGTVSDYVLSFYGLNGSNIFWGTAYTRPFEIGTVSDPMDASTFTSLISWVPSAANYEYFEYFFNEYAGTDEYIAIRGDLNASENQMYLDDLTLDLIPDCVKPLNVHATDIQANQVTLAWTDMSSPAQWNVEYVIAGETPTGVPMETITTNPATITGLTDATDYDFYLQSDCGGGELSAWSVPLTIQTSCIPFDVPVFEDFGEFPPYPEAPEWPICWTPINQNASQWGGMGLSDYNSLTGVCVYMSPEGDAASQMIVSTPEFADGINTLYVNFWLRASECEMLIGTISDPDDYNTFTAYDTVFTDGDEWKNYNVYMNNYTGTDTRIAFRHNSADYVYSQMRIDDITIDAIPSCVEPYQPFVDGATQTSAMLYWTDPMASATDYEIEVGLQGFVVGTGAETNAYTYNNPAPTGDESFEMTELNAATTYDAYIRTDCGAGEYSVWVGPFTFLTGFEAFGTLPVTEDFESGMGITGNDPANVTEWAINTDLKVSGENSAHHMYAEKANDILYMMGTFDLTAKADPMLTFWQIAKTDGGSDVCYIEISTDGGSTYDQLPISTYVGAGIYDSVAYDAEGPHFDEDSYATWGTGYETPDSSFWKKEYFNLTDYNSFDNVVFRFRLVSNNWTNKAGWWIDDIAVESLGTPGFYVDPLIIDESVTADMPVVNMDMTFGNNGGLPVSYTANVVYDESDLLFETFDTEIPSTWTIVNNGSNEVTWADTADISGYTFDGSRFASCDGYQNYGPAATLMDDELISPVIDASAYMALYLEFDQAFDADWNPGDTARVYVYDGADWIMIYESWEDDGTLSWNSNGVHKAYDVSAYANENFQIKFHYIEGSLTSRGQYFAIDNVRLRASMSALGWLTIDGAETASGFSMPDADLLPSIADVMMDATTLADGIYTADIEITSSDAANPMTTVPVTFQLYSILSEATALADPPEVCLGSTTQLSVELVGGSGNETYSWTSDPAGFTSTMSNPVVSPTEETTYFVDVTDGDVTVSSEVTVVVNPMPVVTLDAMDDVCVDEGEFALTGGMPEGGEYTGTGVSNGMFDPATAGVGTWTITYTYTNEFDCEDFAETTITVNPLPDVTFDALDDVCVDEGEFALTGGMPEGGEYAGTGVSNGMFDPATAGVGTYTITYTYANEFGCESYAMSDITVNPLPDVTFDALDDVCVDEGEFTLTGGMPEGGEYTGTGVSNGMFDPATAGVGTFTITYTYANEFGCESYAMTDITVNDLPVVTMTALDTVCVDWSAFELTGGMPEGGVYTGTGVTNGMFDPTAAGVGSHTITYTYIDANGCENYAEEDILVDLCTGINELNDNITINITPNPNNGLFKVYVTAEIAEDAHIRIVNNLGLVVFEENSVSIDHKYSFDMNLVNESKGMYFIHIVTDKSAYIQKVIVR